MIAVEIMFRNVNAYYDANYVCANSQGWYHHLAVSYTITCCQFTYFVVSPCQNINTR